MIKTAFVFPGQGSQSVGMGKEIAEAFPIARAVFEEVDEALQQSLSRIIFEGSEADLTLTSNTQPALMAVSIAVLRVLEQQGKVNLAECAQYVAGHSLGEYTALTAAGAISLTDAARLLRIRGNAMQQAVPAGQGAMAALIGVEFDKAQEIATKAAQGEVCQAANDNGGGQVVISGSVAAIDRAIAMASEYGVKRAIKLPVSAPFHSSLMQPAAVVMENALSQVTFRAPVVPLIANVTAEVVTDPEAIKSQLVQQVTGTVRWRESVAKMASLGVGRTVEIGAGKVLTGLTRRIQSDMEAVSVQTPQDIEQFIKTLEAVSV